MDDLLGRSVGPYRLESVIGRGPTGDVYCGAHVVAGEPAAVKVLHASITVGPDFPERFNATMWLVSSLRRPNIVELRDYGVSDGLYYIAMEVMRAGSVRSLLRQRPPAEPLPVWLATDLIGQAADGLAFAHEQGVLHKDIRPSNLLLDRADEQEGVDDDPYTLKVADFGLAQLAAGGSEMTSVGSLLGAGVMLGQPAYMSPEQCRGRPLDGRSDVYSLGIALYEMLTGMLPFMAVRLAEAARERLYSPPPLPRLLNPEIPPSLEYIMMRCLAKQPDDRFDSAKEFARTLRAATAII